MHDQPLAAILAAEPSIVERIAVLVVCLALGAWMIFVGRANVITRQAEETGKFAVLLSLLGKSSTYEGRTAVVVGWIRILFGAAAIVAGIVFLYFGTLANK